MATGRLKAYTAGALLLTALAGGVIHQRAKTGIPPQAGHSDSPGTGARLVEFDALRKENAALERQVAALDQAPAGEDPRVPAPEGPSVETLVAQAQAALQARDIQAFSDAFLALLDAGDPAIPAVIELMQAMGDKDNQAWLNNERDHPNALRKFETAFMARAPKLGSLADAILAREGELDNATAYALDLIEMGARSRLPRERQAALLLAVLRKADASGFGGPEGPWEFKSQAARILLGNLKAREALPEIEQMVLDRPGGNNGALLMGIAELGGPEAAASLRRILEGNAEIPPWHITNALEVCEGKEANDLLWEIAGKKTDKDSFLAAMNALSARDENLDRIVQVLRDLPIGGTDRSNLLMWLINRGKSKAREQAIWNLYASEQEPARQEEMLQAMFVVDDHNSTTPLDPKLTEAMVRRLQSGQLGWRAAQYLEELDPKILREHAAVLRTLTADHAPGTYVRYYSFSGLFQVDRQGALDALMTGFSGLPDQDRISVIQSVGNKICYGPEARAVLEGIAANDPSQKVRDAASQFLKR